MMKYETIALIGMPGCGKSTVGAFLAQYLDKPFVDLDEAITRDTGRTPEAIIREDGEAAFRAVETEVLRKVSERRGIVLSTGGGTVTRSENVQILRNNSFVIFLDRPLSDIRPSADRPLSQNREALEKLYRERLPIYRESCDLRIACGSSVTETVARIVENLS